MSETDSREVAELDFDESIYQDIIYTEQLMKDYCMYTE